MADMRDALRKAGVVSEKKIRQAKHRDRVRRKESGADGLDRERLLKEEEHRAELARKKREDLAREQRLRAQKETDAQQARLRGLLLENDLMAREGGPRRFYFETPSGPITFLDVSPHLARRLSQGVVAIVNSGDVLGTDFAAIPGKTAHELKALEADRIIFWNTRT